MGSIVKIYTDGACSGNQNDENVGGWGAILTFGEYRKELHGGEKNTTNNRMEITAVIEAFRALNRTGLTIEVYSDSAYVCDCFRKKWYVKWEKNGWLTANRGPVENRGLWEELIGLTRAHDVTFFRVKGHVDPSDDKALRKFYPKFCEWNGEVPFEDFQAITLENNRADALANAGIDENR